MCVTSVACFPVLFRLEGLWQSCTHSYPSLVLTEFNSPKCFGMWDVYSFHQGHLFLNAEIKSAACLKNLIYKISSKMESLKRMLQWKPKAGSQIWVIVLKLLLSCLWFLGSFSCVTSQNGWGNEGLAKKRKPNISHSNTERKKNCEVNSCNLCRRHERALEQDAQHSNDFLM